MLVCLIKALGMLVEHIGFIRSDFFITKGKSRELYWQILLFHTNIMHIFMPIVVHIFALIRVLFSQTSDSLAIFLLPAIVFGSNKPDESVKFVSATLQGNNSLDLALVAASGNVCSDVDFNIRISRHFASALKICFSFS